MKTSELTGAALDWAVAKCEGLPFTHGDCEYSLDGRVFQRGGCSVERRYSTNWAQGGPIIEREFFHRIVRNLSNGYTVSKKLVVLTDDDDVIRWTHGSGPTPLVAAMRCYVASKLGDTVEIPEELTK